MRPDKLPRWADVGGHLVEPPDGKKDIGFLVREKPGPGYTNWLINNLCKWGSYLDPLTGDGAPGRLLLLRDDFTGDRIDRSKWQGATAGNALLTLADDSANGGFGVLQLNAASAAAWQAQLTMQQMPMGALNWRLVARLRYVNAGLWSTGLAKIGLLPGGGADASAYLEVGPGVTNFKPVVNGVVYGPFSFPGVTTHDIVELECLGGTITVIINGLVVDSLIPYTGGLVLPGFSSLGSTTNDGSIYVDDYTLAIDRLSTTGLAFNPTPPHEEIVIQSITLGAGNLHQWIDVSFGSNFGDTNYILADPTIDLTVATDPNPGFPTLVSKTISGCRIKFDSAFNGVFRGKLKEMT